MRLILFRKLLGFRSHVWKTVREIREKIPSPGSWNPPSMVGVFTHSSLTSNTQVDSTDRDNVYRIPSAAIKVIFTVLSWLIPQGEDYSIFAILDQSFYNIIIPRGLCYPMCFENKIFIAPNFVCVMETHPPTMCSDLCSAHTFAFDQEFSVLLQEKTICRLEKTIYN